MKKWICVVIGLMLMGCSALDDNTTARDRARWTDMGHDNHYGHTILFSKDRLGDTVWTVNTHWGTVWDQYNGESEMKLFVDSVASLEFQGMIFYCLDDNEAFKIPYPTYERAFGKPSDYRIDKTRYTDYHYRR